MKYRELMESCDRILESPEIKMFDQYMLVNDFKNFYLESHNFIKDNIMSLPYEFSKDIYSEYFIEEEEVGSAEVNGDGNKKSNSSDGGGWTKDSKGQYEYKEGDHFVNALKAIGNFFIRLWEIIKGAWHTLFNTDNEYNWVKNAKATVASSANSPEAPSAAVDYAYNGFLNIENTLIQINNNNYIKTEFNGKYEKEVQEILNIIKNDKRKEYEADDTTNWVKIANFKSLVDFNIFNPYKTQTLKILPKYTKAKIRVPKVSMKDDKNEYDEGNSKANEQNYDVKELTASLLSDLATKHAEKELNKDEGYKKETDNNTKNTTKATKIKAFFDLDTINGYPIMVKQDYAFVNLTDDQINQILINIREAMRSSPMSNEEKNMHEAISMIHSMIIQLIIGVMESAITILEKMCNNLSSATKEESKDTNKDAADAENTINNESKQRVINKIRTVSNKLFKNDDKKNTNSYSYLLNKVGGVINSIRKSGQNSPKPNQAKVDSKLIITKDDNKFSELGKIIFASIYLLMNDELRFVINVIPTPDAIKVNQGLTNLFSTLTGMNVKGV